METQIISDKLREQIASLDLYIVMNSDGNFFRAKGYGGYGDTWTDDIKKAKSYGKLGQARSRVTWFANNFPKYPAPVIVKFSIGSFTILDEKERVAKAMKSKEQKELERQERRAKDEFASAQRNLARAQEELEKAKKKVGK